MDTISLNSNLELTIKEVDLPIDQTFTFWSSPPVAKSRQVFFPILRQFTLPEWATNSSISNQVRKTNWSNNNYSIWLPTKFIHQFHVEGSNMTSIWLPTKFKNKQQNTHQKKKKTEPQSFSVLIQYLDRAKSNQRHEWIFQS